MEFLEGVIWYVMEWEEKRSLIELINSVKLGSIHSSTFNLYEIAQKYAAQVKHKLDQKFKNLESFCKVLMADLGNRVDQVEHEEIVDTYLIMFNHLELVSEQLKPFLNSLKWCLSKEGRALTEEDVEYLGEVQFVEHVEVKAESKGEPQQPQPLGDDLTLGQVIGWIYGKFKAGLDLILNQITAAVIRGVGLIVVAAFFWLFNLDTDSLPKEVRERVQGSEPTLLRIRSTLSRGEVSWENECLGLRIGSWISLIVSTAIQYKESYNTPCCKH